MKRTTLLLTASTFLLISFIWGTHQSGYVKKGKHESESKRDGIRLAFEQDFEMMKDPALGYVPYDRMIAAKQYKDFLLRKTRGAIAGITWNSLGPNNQGGRTRTMLIDAKDTTDNTVFAAGVGGGLWKTTNISSATPNWAPINDFLDNLAVTSIAQDPTNDSIMYIGTGEIYSGDAIEGLGIWKSTNGGNTWSQLASTNNDNFHHIQKVLVNETGIIFAATFTGIWRSGNGGASFSRVLGAGLDVGPTFPSFNYAYDVIMAGNGDLYAALDSSVYKSTDHGYNWGAPLALPVPAERMILASAPSNPDCVYILAEHNGEVGGILQTLDAGVTWTLRNEPVDADPGVPNTDFSNGQAWYDLSMAVDPNDENVLYVGGLDLFKSTDAANSWTQISHWYGGFGSQYTHADQHFIYFKPGSSSMIYFCNDGGIFQTTNGTDSIPAIADKGANYVTSQFYGCAMHPEQGKAHYLGGTQDNGTHLFTQNSISSTVQVTGGDGAYCNIDQNEPQFQFTQYIFNNYFRSVDGGGAFNYIPASGGLENSGRFINPTDYDDSNNVMYASTIKDSFLRWEDPQTGGTFTPVPVPGFGGYRVSAIKVSPNTNHRVFMGVGSGQLFRIDSAHTNTPVVTNISTGLPFAYLSCVEVETGNDDHLLITYSNFGLQSVWESMNGGTSWTSIEGNLPDMPVRWALFNPKNADQALIATELGVWSTDNLNGASTIWAPSNSGLANVRVDQIQARISDYYLIASTHGRGMFGSDVFTDTTALFTADKKITYTGVDIQFTNESYKSTSWMWDFGDSTSSNLENPLHKYTKAGIYSVKLTINSGVSSLTKTAFIHILPNRAIPYLLADGGDFETNPFDFGGDHPTPTHWELGSSTIPGKDSVRSGANAWVTGLTQANYGDNTDARLMTPNFNMTKAGAYYIQFYRKNSFEIDYDGFRVEYTLDKGLTWTPLGTVPQIDWYDFANNTGGTGSFDFGEAFFNNDQATYSLCKYDISSLSGNNSVAFRLRMRSDGGVTMPGVAIDDFELTGPINYPLNTANTNQAGGIVISPNPFKSFIQIKTEEVIKSVHLISVTGSIIYRNSTIKDHLIQLNDKIAPGMYMLVVVTNKGIYKERVVKND